MVAPKIKSIDDLSVNMEVIRTFVFDAKDLQAFTELTGDNAPIHHDREFAIKQGYRDCVIFGFQVASRFSGMLGMELPGPYTVLHSASWQMVKPAYAGERLEYHVKVRQITKAVGAVTLDMLVRNERGETVLRGNAQCGFRSAP